MTAWSGKFVLLLVFVVMPLQGAAATLAGLLCDPGVQMHKMHANDGHDSSMHQGGDRDTGNNADNSVWHPFHSTVFGAAVVTSLAAAPNFPFPAFAPGPWFYLFVPELPQRPPRA